MRITVHHGSYGCETGCCGHWIEVDGERFGRFNFSHPSSMTDEDVKEFVRDKITDAFGAEHVADIDWDNCHVSDD